MKTTFLKIKNFHLHIEGWKQLIDYYQPKSLDEEVTIEEIIKSNGVKDAIWALRTLDEEDRYKIVLFASEVAEMCLHNFENRFPQDSRVRECLGVIKKFINNECSLDELRAAEATARLSSLSAWSAVESAIEQSAATADSATWSAWFAAESATWAVWSAWFAAESATWAVWSAAKAADDAANSAWFAAKSAATAAWHADKAVAERDSESSEFVKFVDYKEIEKILVSICK